MIKLELNTPRATFVRSPIPKRMKKTGTSAVAGIERKKSSRKEAGC
jgi:hypothetical protein